MPILSNPFIEVVNAMNGIPTKPRGLTSALQQRYKAREAAMYITMHQVLAQVTDLLAPGEQLVNLLPMTNEANSAAGSDGVMGMYAPKMTTAKAYVAAQASLRGNRLLVFTTRRMLFLVVIEFLDDPTAYFSYPYTHIQAMKLKQRRMSIPGNHHFWSRETITWAVVDFQTTDGNIFTETLTSANAALLKRNLLEIPAMADIVITDHVTRVRRLDYWLSNVNLQVRLGLGCFGLIMLPPLVYGIVWAIRLALK
ncbi:hypothetical protein [Lacticaseibacillus daqingensis]|uniref:hypothetical protein n=1 Tax=Lacticaseibacillus daqingensis TaxID=2486014 RepID=UPI000F79A25F|nr:hypothetical protein [Lacticaseibacillus daqingensis]